VSEGWEGRGYPGCFVSPKGELLQRKNMTDNPERLNISRYAKGIYYVEVLNERKALDVQKLIIK